jgi:serine/threonine protein kinase
MSDPERERRLEQLFHLAIEIPLEEREEFVARNCAQDEELRRMLSALLERDGEGTPAALQKGVFSRPEKPRERVGNYTLLEVLGEGGMGVVHLAQQEDPVRRKVALKMIRPGLATEDALVRFETERQALATLNDPGIAQLLDAGKTESGLPYFVMEYVPGRKLTAFCDEERLTIEERLALFAQICEAVQHAHQMGIIHRDLKPANVLVVENDSGPMPKIIDFGVARAVSGHRGRWTTR